MGYQQFCPIAKAMEVLGEKWTFLIVRELLLGSSRFNEFQRGLPLISPTLLTKRLASLEAHGILVKKAIKGQKGYEYFPTESCKELYPVMEQIGIWGMRWAQSQLTDEDYDLTLLMLYMEKSIQPEKLIGNETVIRFNFTDVHNYPNWWVVVEGESIDVCVHDPGKEVDVYFNVAVKDMCDIWMGQISYKQAIKEGILNVVGHSSLTRNIETWIKPSVFSGIKPAVKMAV